MQPACRSTGFERCDAEHALNPARERARAAHKALEFLIRRFEIHKYNVAAVLGCILPYHSTRWSVRMVR